MEELALAAEDASWGWFVATDPSLGVEVASNGATTFAAAAAAAGSAGQHHHALPPCPQPLLPARIGGRGDREGCSSGAPHGSRGGADMDAWLAMLDDEDLGVPVVAASVTAAATPPSRAPAAVSSSCRQPVPAVAPPAAAPAGSRLASVAGMVPASLVQLFSLLASPFMTASRHRGGSVGGAPPRLQTSPPSHVSPGPVWHTGWGGASLKPKARLLARLTRPLRRALASSGLHRLWWARITILPVMRFFLPAQHQPKVDREMGEQGWMGLALQVARVTPVPGGEQVALAKEPQ